MPLAKNYKLCMRAGHSAAVYSSRISRHFNTILSRMLSPASIPYPGHLTGVYRVEAVTTWPRRSRT